MHRRALLLAFALAIAAGPVCAHHGLTIWDEQNSTTVEGFVSHELTGFPHWEIKIRDAEGRDWRIDLGNGFEMEHAGLRKDGSDLTIGTKIVVEGHRPLHSDTLLIRPDRITAGDKVYRLRRQVELTQRRQGPRRGPRRDPRSAISRAVRRS